MGRNGQIRQGDQVTQPAGSHDQEIRLPGIGRNHVIRVNVSVGLHAVRQVVRIQPEHVTGPCCTVLALEMSEVEHDQTFFRHVENDT